MVGLGVLRKLEKILVDSADVYWLLSVVVSEEQSEDNSKYYLLVVCVLLTSVAYNKHYLLGGQ
jgi:hypothetical protein